MQIRVLGCHGADCLADTTERPLRWESCGFLIDDSVLLDAGTIGARLTLAEQRDIRFVLLSHLHFDHIKGLPTLADNLAEEFDAPLIVAATESVIQGLMDHVFNNTIYPNFFALPDRRRPILQARILEPGKPVTLGHLEVTPVPVNHSVPTVGYVVNNGRAAFLYSGDTYQTEEIWRLGRTIPELKAAFIESSFPDEFGELAKRSKHLTPALFLKEFQKIGRPELPVYAYHMKPAFRTQIEQEIRRLGIEQAAFLEEDQIVTL
ncbi:MAG TPA: 3',5'-cyclic-nucleotide phosphodiesterase [Nitrospira sp.]|nr:3',5'-cyclic-nucleotide phosphodiesterase [Nitrospira sp.]